jgi:hypothetical protein
MDPNIIPSSREINEISTRFNQGLASLVPLGLSMSEGTADSISLSPAAFGVPLGLSMSEGTADSISLSPAALKPQTDLVQTKR